MAATAVILLFTAFLGAGLYGARRAQPGTEQFLLGGRGVPLWMGIVAMTAAWVDGGYLLGTAEGVFKHSVASGLQGGVLYGMSLVLGGLFFASRMRRAGYTTLVDPFAARYGNQWAAVLMVPALVAELLWCAELLAALGATFGVLGGISHNTAIVTAAMLVTFYTALGGLWSVAYADVVQMAVMVIGVTLVASMIAPALAARPYSPPVTDWPAAESLRFADVSVMLLFGGIPWNCYFQRVLSCRSERDARTMSVTAGLLVSLFTLPPLLIGMAATNMNWPDEVLARLRQWPSEVFPAVLRYAVPGWVGFLGLAAIVGAVTSSYSSSLLSASTLFAWNLWRPWRGEATRASIRSGIALIALLATLLALKAQSVQALWLFTSDLVFVVLFPQLLFALYDPRTTRTASITAFVVSLVLRLGAGESLVELPALIPFPEWFPHRTFAAVAGLVILPLVSRWRRPL